jgi:hypothetical protein
MYTDNYHDNQLNAIRDYYLQLKQDGDQEVEMQDVVIAWLTGGQAEKMREDFLEQAVAVGQ